MPSTPIAIWRETGVLTANATSPDSVQDPSCRGVSHPDALLYYNRKTKCEKGVRQWNSVQVSLPRRRADARCQARKTRIRIRVMGKKAAWCSGARAVTDKVARGAARRLSTELSTGWDGTVEEKESGCWTSVSFGESMRTVRQAQRGVVGLRCAEEHTSPIDSGELESALEPAGLFSLRSMCLQHRSCRKIHDAASVRRCVECCDWPGVSKVRFGAMGLHAAPL